MTREERLEFITQRSGFQGIGRQMKELSEVLKHRPSAPYFDRSYKKGKRK